MNLNTENILPLYQGFKCSRINFETTGFQSVFQRGFTPPIGRLIEVRRGKRHSYIFPRNFDPIQIGHKSIIEVHIQQQGFNSLNIGNRKYITYID